MGGTSSSLIDGRGHEITATALAWAALGPSNGFLIWLPASSFAWAFYLHMLRMFEFFDYTLQGKSRSGTPGMDGGGARGKTVRAPTTPRNRGSGSE